MAEVAEVTGWCAKCGEARRGISACPCGWPYPPEDFYFPSGSNHLGEIRGFLGETCMNVGVSASELSDDAVQELLVGPCRLSGTGSVFLDSGAFSEVSFGPGGPRVVAPIADREWGRRLRIARELAEKWGDRLWVVTPDRVGCQRTTIDRLRSYRRAVQGLYARGARLIFPVQRGAWLPVAFWVGSLHAAGFTSAHEWLIEGRVLPGIPSKKDATTLRELRHFARVRAEEAAGRMAAAKGERPWLYWHLLGCGPRSRGYAARVAAICEEWPESVVSSDSVLLRAVVGRGRGRPRPLTRARDEVLAEGLPAERVADVKQAALGRWYESVRARRAGAGRASQVVLDY